MAFRQIQDSLSRCDPHLYSNMYDVRKRSDIKHEPIIAPLPIHKDTIEISHDKLKEEALNCLRHTSKYVIAQSSFMRIGKYLFLAIAFPPYLMIYGLPKWILVEGIPAVFSVCVWVWKKVQHQTQKQVDAGIHKVTQMKNALQRLAQVVIQPFTRLALELWQGMHRMRERAYRFFKSKTDKINIKFAMPHLKVPERLKEMQKKLSEMKEKWMQQAQTMATRVQEGVQWIKQIPQLFLGWGQAQFQRLSQQAVSWSTPFTFRFQNSWQLAQQTTNGIVKQFKKGIEGFKRAFHPLNIFYRQQLQPIWQKLKEVCKDKGQQTRDFFHQKHQKSLAFLQEKQKKLKNLSYQRFADGALAHAWILPLRLQDGLKKCLALPIVKAMGELGIRIYTLLTSYFLRAATQLLYTISKGVALIFKTCKQGQVFLKSVSQKALNLLMSIYNICHRVILRTLYYFLLGVMMTAILLIWGLRSLGDLMSSLTSTLHFKIQLLFPKR